MVLHTTPACAAKERPWATRPRAIDRRAPARQPAGGRPRSCSEPGWKRACRSGGSDARRASIPATSAGSSLASRRSARTRSSPWLQSSATTPRFALSVERAAGPGPRAGADARGLAASAPSAVASTARGARLSTGARGDRRRAGRHGRPAGGLRRGPQRAPRGRCAGALGRPEDGCAPVGRRAGRGGSTAIRERSRLLLLRDTAANRALVGIRGSDVLARRTRRSYRRGPSRRSPDRAPWPGSAIVWVHLDGSASRLLHARRCCRS